MPTKRGAPKKSSFDSKTRENWGFRDAKADKKAGRRERGTIGGQFPLPKDKSYSKGYKKGYSS